MGEATNYQLSAIIETNVVAVTKGSHRGAYPFNKDRCKDRCLLLAGLSR